MFCRCSEFLFSSYILRYVCVFRIVQSNHKILKAKEFLLHFSSLLHNITSCEVIEVSQDVTFDLILNIHILVFEEEKFDLLEVEAGC